MAELVRGVGYGPVNAGERRVVSKLVDDLPAGWKLLPNIEVRAGDGRMLEIDCIVAAPHAVYLLEVKDWRGAIQGDDNTWVHNDRSQPSPNKQINYKAKVVKDVLGDADRGLRSVSVESFVVLARAPERLDLAPGTRRHTRLIDEIGSALRDTSLLPGASKPAADLPERVARALAPLVLERGGPHRIGEWKVLETLGQDEDSSVYRVANTLLASGPEARMTVWHLSSYRMTDAERRRERKAILQDFTAVQHMGPHRLVVGARAAFEDGDDVVVVTDEPVGVPLAQRLASGPAIDPDTRLVWIEDLAEAISHAHSHGVVHRRITPETILIVAGGVRLAGFGHARIAAEGTIRHDPRSVEGREARYLAPEVVDPSLGGATERSDLFGLAAVAWTIWSGTLLPPTWQTSGGPPARPEEMPVVLWAVIEPLLDVQPDHRTVTLDQFRRAITEAMAGPASGVLPLAPAVYPVGSLIANRYEVTETLGSGGFAVVYRTIDRELGAARAVKVLDARTGSETGVREMRALERVSHPHVMRVRHIDRTPTRPPQWYITSEIAPGEPLSNVGRLPVAEAVEIADQLLDACIAFHPPAAGEGGLAGDGGIVHRDIKPSNVIYDRGSRHATLIDFNIASAGGSAVVTMAGTPTHQPPDADHGRWSPDPDLFGIGVLLFELLTGDHPYADGRNPSSGVRSLASVRSEAPAALSQFLGKATNPNRRERFPSAAAMRASLHGSMADAASVSDGVADEAEPEATQQPAPTVRDDPAPEAVDSPDAVPSPAALLEVDAPGGSARGDTGRRLRRRVLIAAAVLVTGGLAAAGAVALSGSDAPGELEASTSEPSSPTTSETRSATTSELPLATTDRPTTTFGSTAVPAAPVAAANEVEPAGQQCPAGFPVKGNINESGELIFHDVGWRFYDNTWPERCFADRAAATAAGFRASKVQ